jgi:hypothetical protein
MFIQVFVLSGTIFSSNYVRGILVRDLASPQALMDFDMNDLLTSLRN